MQNEKLESPVRLGVASETAMFAVRPSLLLAVAVLLLMVSMSLSRIWRYRFFCTTDMPVKRMVSVLGSSDFSTSALRRRTQQLVQLADDALLGLGVVHVQLEPIVELFGRCEHVRQQEVQQRPQLVQVVLQTPTFLIMKTTKM